MTKDRNNMQHSYIELFLISTTGASSGAYSSQMIQGMGVSAQSTRSGLQSQSVSCCFRAGSGGQNSMGGCEAFELLQSTFHRHPTSSEKQLGL
uniref:Uncharacterized protein n=1 Tax=Ailuropoda melanoleuca TaxID=9646 RepID=A0A7N5JTN3_AILME